MTKSELRKINKRVREIVDLLESGVEDDIFDNLIAELNNHIAELEKAYKIARIKESGLRII